MGGATSERVIVAGDRRGRVDRRFMGNGSGCWTVGGIGRLGFSASGSARKIGAALKACGARRRARRTNWRQYKSAIGAEELVFVGETQTKTCGYPA